MDIIGLAAALASGAVGGHLEARAAGQTSQGAYGNVLGGTIGGLIGAQILERAMGLAPVAWDDLGLIAVQCTAGAAGGGALVFIIGGLRAMLSR